MSTINAPRPSPETDPRVHALRDALSRVRVRARALLLARGGAWVLGGALGGVIALIAIDYALRLPSGLRWLMLLGAVAALGVALARIVGGAWRFAPSLTSLALRLERLDPSASGQIASGLELASEPKPEEPAARAMHERALDDAKRAFRPGAAGRLTDPRQTLRALGGLALVSALALSFVLVKPTLSRTGAARVLTPWRGAEWPSRYVVEDATLAQVHPSDTALPLRAIVTRTSRAQGRTLVNARYRLTDATGFSPSGETRRVVLAGQRRDAKVGEHEGELYERLIEAIPPPRAGEGARSVTLEYWFETDDDRTRTRKVRLVDPPVLVGAAAVVTPPDYASASTGVLASGLIELGASAESAPPVGPVLGGSRVELTLRFSTPVTIDQAQRQSWLEQLRRSARDVSVTSDAGTVTLSMTLDESLRAAPPVVDANALAPRDEVAFVFEATQDQAPSVSVTAPARDESVLATAVIAASGEGRDDLGLRWVALERTIAKAPSGSPGAPPEAVGESVIIARAELDASQGVTSAQANAGLDLSTLGVVPGDEVRIVALALDTQRLDDIDREPSRSGVRTLRVISETDLIEQIRGELGGVRRAAMRLDETQQTLEQSLEHNGPSPDLQQQQDAMTQRLIEQRQVIERLRQRQRRNALSDQSLAGMLDEAQGMLSRAGQRSSDAAQKTGQSMDEPEDSKAEQLREEGVEAQDDVREELGSLIALLDRGEDGWLVRRAVERLLQEQKRIREETARAGQETLGRELSELSPRELSDLERIAQRQRDAAEQAREALDELGERGRQMSQVDPAQGEAMSQAARQGREQGLQESLEEASQQISQNQTGGATQNQDEAIQALEQMLEELDNAGKNKDSALRRMLASIIESIEALITRQQREIANLADAKAKNDYTGLDAGMIRLDQNTLGVLAQVREGPGEMRAVGDLLEEASGQQREAIGLLREGEIVADGVSFAEGESLRLLSEAKAEAEKIDEQAQDREQDRLRAELRQAYRETLEEQVALSAESGELLGGELTRRQRAGVRAMGARQRTLQERLQTLLGEVEGLGDSLMFALAHEQLDSLMGTAADALGQGQVSRGVVLNQSMSIQTLQMLVEALGQPEPDEQEFEEGGGGGGGQGGGPQPEQPLVPPMAELMLLRSMQAQIAQLTRRAHEGDERASGIEARTLSQMQRRLGQRAGELIEQMNQPQGEDVELPVDMPTQPDPAPEETQP